MTNLTRTADILADDWRRQQGDAVQLLDPALNDLPAGELADLAERVAADYERDLAALKASARFRERPFVIDWPALARWRTIVLRDQRRHPAYVVAAALEAMALECALAGHEDLADRARAQAESVVLGRRVDHTAPTDSPHQELAPTT